MEKAGQYIVALKRTHRGQAPEDWIAALEALPGVHVTGQAGGVRVQVDATDQGVTNLRQAVGSYCHIEPVLPHERLGGAAAE